MEKINSFSIIILIRTSCYFNIMYSGIHIDNATRIVDFVFHFSFSFRNRATESFYYFFRKLPFGSVKVFPKQFHVSYFWMLDFWDQILNRIKAQTTTVFLRARLGHVTICVIQNNRYLQRLEKVKKKKRCIFLRTHRSGLL